MFRSLHMKLVLIMLLLIVSLMTVVGAFLINGVIGFYINGFYDQEYVIRRQHGEEPGKHRLTEKAGSTSGYLREGKV